MDEDFHHIVIRPLAVWGGLLLLLLLSIGYAYVPGGPAKLEIGLLVAAAKLALIAEVFMELRKASPLVRVAAAAGAFWLGLLFLFSFADFLTR